MSFFLCKLWPYLAGGLVGWLLAGWLARRFKHAEPPVERIVEKIVEVDNPQHLSLIKKLEGENSQIAGLMSKVSQFESKKPEAAEKVIEKRVEVDNPKHLALISKLEKENAEMLALKEKLSTFEAQEATLRKLKEENAQISVLQNRLKSFESKSEVVGGSESDVTAEVTRYKAQIEELEKENKELVSIKSQENETLTSDNTKVDSLQGDLSRLKSDNDAHLSLIAKLKEENKELEELRRKASTLDAQSQKIAQLEVENKKIVSLQSDNTQHLSLIGKLEQEKTHIGNKLTDLEGEVSSLKRGPKLDLSAAKSVGLTIKDENDLTVIEGIGPKIAELLKENSIKNLKDLADSDAGKIKQILNKGGSQYQMANPETWSDQATLACNNRWPALKSLQDVLDGGVYPDIVAKANKISSVSAKLDLSAAKSVGISVTDEGDFTAIEGIGPKISELIHADGIKTFKELSEVDPSRLQKILDNAGPQYKMANPGTWPDQAHLACNNRWPALKALQDILDGGVYPDGSKTSTGSKEAAKVEKLEAELKTYRDKEQATASSASVADVDKAKAAGFTMRRKGDQDDFTVIEGIGPKINELIHAEGIHTFAALASTDISVIQTILDKAGPSFTLADPGTWAAQSELAAKNEWGKLMKWQDELDGGR